MKIIQRKCLFDSSAPLHRSFIEARLGEIEVAIANIKYPVGTNCFSINPTRQGNGVKPIKDAFIRTLVGYGWLPEYRVSLVDGVRPGPIDAFFHDPQSNYQFAVEWETGNISSSHRAIEKLISGIMQNNVNAGALVLPSRKLYKFLTDRVGNYDELVPYFQLWESWAPPGMLCIFEVEHDLEDSTVALIPKGTDGRALR